MIFDNKECSAPQVANMINDALFPYNLHPHLVTCYLCMLVLCSLARLSALVPACCY
jgi:hypothetical protein